MKKIYTYVLNTLADWEIGMTVAELNTHRFFDQPGDFRVRTFALTKEPVKTMGGFTILPDYEFEEVSTDDAALLILPGAEEWAGSRHALVLELAQEFLDANIPVAAICGATEAMARAGMLNDKEHTSNGPGFLKMTCPDYTGDALYRDEPAVTSGNLITAGSSSSVALAFHILRKLGVMTPENLQYWHGYFENHSIPDIMKLIKNLE